MQRTTHSAEWDELFSELFSNLLLEVLELLDFVFNCLSLFWNCWIVFYMFIFMFPTCQVRVVRFYQSCSPPPPPRLAVLL